MPMLKINKILTVGTMFSAFAQHCDKDFKFAGEQHNFWEFLYITDGSMGVCVDDRIYELKKGQMIFYAPMEFHSIWSSGGADADFIIMSFSLNGEGFQKLSGGVFDVSVQNDKLIRIALEHASVCKNYDDNIQNQLLSNKLEELMLNLLIEKTTPILEKRTPGTENYKKIINVMKKHINENLSSEQIARLCDMSLANLKKTFKKYAGMGVMKYYNNLRIMKSMDLMRDGRNMAEISEILNFSSQQYFTEVFKRQCGMTPSEHKRRYL